MKQSQLFTKTRKEAPADEVSKNAQLLIRAGYIHKTMAGVYSLLPLGVKVSEKIAYIIREEMNAIGGQETQSAALQKKEIWEATNRWSDKVTDNWFKTELKNGTELGLAFTHEEATVDMMQGYISSYKDLPAYPYDIRTMFRNEKRAKSGLMRGREFFWKALYSFSENKEQHDEFYEKSKIAYANVFNRVGIGHLTYLTFASGGSFAKYSHEFQTISEAGEDIIYLDEKSGTAINKEVFNDEVKKDLGLKDAEFTELKTIETGNIFDLGTKFSEPGNLKFKDEDGNEQFVHMGSYGIGISRLIGAIAEVLSDDKGLIWPEEIAPFTIHLVTFGKNENIFRDAESLYHDLKNAGIDVLFDDRDAGPGQKLADADLMGMPYRIVYTERSLENGGVEITKRETGETEYVDPARVIAHFTEG
ncbi:MAG: His/Gly/Thr/Pro-type tRNA ligase C-terminal domain-containing protein [Candidatus Pacebacteria bacterium]|nr:His/Gly/Thr/Pro-type tRNA ligase C-terminal domain-containing protein [Candidatus Paceibacterota bacterium]